MNRPAGAADLGAVTKQILQRCDRLARISDEPGRITRGFLSPAMEEANTQVAGWMQQAGLRTEIDVAGNLIGTFDCGLEDAPLLVLGSHLDTVRDAGRYDGILGVLLAISVLEVIEDTHLPFDIEVIAFADEEGLRYGVPFLGSRALIGDFDPTFLDRCDQDGVTMGEAIRSWGGKPEDICCRYTHRRTIGYLEAHIEQGIWLEHHGLALGVLEALSCSCWLRLRIDGKAGHAGTTPMGLRFDAMPAAAEMILVAEQIARNEEDLVATVGRLVPTPGAGNVIAGRVELSLDIRHPNSRFLSASIDRFLESCRQIADRRGLQFSFDVLHRQDGVEAHPRLSQVLAEAVADATETGAGSRSGADTARLVIGAGHDALMMSKIMPITMLMVRSPGGISHHPDEAVLPEDVVAALGAMSAFVHRLVQEESSTDRQPAWELAWPTNANAEEGTWDTDR